MAEPLRYPDIGANKPTPDQPNMNVVPPAAPFGSADPITTAGASYRASSGASVVSEPDFAYRPGIAEADDAEGESTVLERWFEHVRQHAHYIADSVRSGTLQRDLQGRVEIWMDQASDAVDHLQHSAAHLAHHARFRAAELRDRLVVRSQDVQASTKRFIDERPAQAIAVAAGAGLLIGILLRLGRSRREH